MIAFLADTHIGTKLSPMDYLKSLDRFIEIIKKHKEECHCIFVCGDLFDHRLTIEEARLASLFIVNLVCNHCGRNGRTHVPVHFIHGTYSHDYEQYGIYMPLIEKIDNTEVFYTKETCVGKLRNGMSILYLPQIYGEFDYSKYFNKKYDIIVGHGPVSSTTKNPCKSKQDEIVHSADKLGDISKICVFGHYHGYTDFGKNVFYAGPWLRWRYGEDEPRKFFICNDNFEVETFDNLFALEYKTLEINDPEELRQKISEGITTPHRFIIKTTDNEDLQTYHAIMATNKRNQNLSYKIMQEEPVVGDESLTQSSVTEESNNMDIGPIPSLVSYISEKYGVDAEQEVLAYEEKINKGV